MNPTPAGVADGGPALLPECDSWGIGDPVAARLRRLPPANLRHATGVLKPPEAARTVDDVSD
jgi:hypothetical protein